MATNIPPHNLGELVDVLCALIHNPDATVSVGKIDSLKDWMYYECLASVILLVENRLC